LSNQPRHDYAWINLLPGIPESGVIHHFAFAGLYNPTFECNPGKFFEMFFDYPKLGLFLLNFSTEKTITKTLGEHFFINPTRYKVKKRKSFLCPIIHSSRH